MDSYLRHAFPNENGPGACLLIAEAGQVRTLECCGLANLQSARPITPQTNFRLASITKQFTAACILLLREEGRISLEDPIGNHLPGLPEALADGVTVRQLLNHTSGLPDYEDNMLDDPDACVMDDEVLAIVRRVGSTYFPPGSQFRYSNTGYALLACIVQTLRAQPFSVALEEMIFRPLQMDSTVALDERHRPVVPHRAYGYRPGSDGDTFTFSDQSATSHVLGDGGIYCSAEDYLKWDRALWSGALLPREVVQEMITPGRLRNPEPAPMTGLSEAAVESQRVWFPDDMNEPVHGEGGDDSNTVCKMAGGVSTNAGCEIPYGLGWRLEINDDNLRVAYHPGSSTGFMHCVRHVPERGLTVLVLANRTVALSKELARDIEKHLIS